MSESDKKLIERMKMEAFEEYLSTPIIYSEQGQFSPTISYRHDLWGTTMLEWDVLKKRRETYVKDHYQAWWDEKEAQNQALLKEEQERNKRETELNEVKKRALSKLSQAERSSLGLKEDND